MTSYKVEQFYNKNQFLIKGRGETIFQSYNSTIAVIYEGRLILGDDWDYSNTTLKHLYLFLNDYKTALFSDLRKEIEDALNSRNKKKAIQNLISQRSIDYDFNL